MISANIVKFYGSLVCMARCTHLRTRRAPIRCSFGARKHERSLRLVYHVTQLKYVCRWLEQDVDMHRANSIDNSIHRTSDQLITSGAHCQCLPRWIENWKNQRRRSTKKALHDEWASVSSNLDKLSSTATSCSFVTSSSIASSKSARVKSSKMLLLRTSLYYYYSCLFN